jgi:anti-sigma factor RsiW
MTPREHELLSRFIDDELDPAEQREVEDLLDRDPHAAAHVEGLLAMRGLVAEAHAAQLPALDADALFAGIERQLAAEGALPSPHGAPPRAQTAPVLSIDARRRQRRAVVPVLASLAAAAAALLVFLGPRAARDVASDAPGAQVVAAPGPSGSQIDDVDFGGSTGTVFEIDNEGVSAAVVWISDDEENTP